MGVGRGFHWAGGALGVLEVAELRPLCGGGGRKEREGSERVGHTDSRGEILSQTNDKSGPIGLAKQFGKFILPIANYATTVLLTPTICLL